jgi:hypothetical protein
VLDNLKNLRPAFERGTLLPLCTILLVSVILMLPIWWFGFPLSGHDTGAHVNWQHFFSRQLWNGDLYPRWLAGINDGLGSPVFFIYPPLSQYAAALLAPFSDSPAWVYQRVGIAATAAFVVSGMGAYFWLYEVTKDRISALTGAFVFLLAPYHLLTDTYVRAAYAELWAFAWAPFSLLALHLFRKKLITALLLYTGATVALLLSHAPSCIALLPAYLAYAGLLSMMYKEKRIFLWSVLATFLALLIAGAYLATALTHQQYINSSALYSGYNNFFQWLLGSGKRWPTLITEQVIIGTALTQCSAAAFFGFIVIKRTTPASRSRQLAWFSMLVSFLTLFLASVFSKPVWDLVPFAQKIQFPWRLFTTQTIFLALICALYVQSFCSGTVGSRTRYIKRLMGAFIAGLAIVNAGLVYYDQPYFRHAAPLPSDDTPEYRLGSLDSARAMFQKNETARLLTGQGSLSVEVVTPRHLRVHTDAKTPVKFVLRHFYYPEWRCTLTGGGGDCQVTRLNPDLPLITVSTGPGKQQIDLQLSGPGERMGYIASVIGIGLLIGLCLGMHFLERRRKKKEACPVKNYHTAQETA